MNATEVLNKCDEIRARLERVSKCGDGLEETRQEILGFTKVLQALPPTKEVTFRKIVVSGPDLLAEALGELKQALVEKGFRVL